MFNSIDKKKALLDSKWPFPTYTFKSLREKFLLDWTYHSNAIEGNTLTIVETKVVLEGITVGGKTVREHLEIINHLKAITYVEELISKNEALSQDHIKNIHQLLLKGIDENNAGVYRNQQVFISGATHVPPAFTLLNEKMKELIKWYDSTANLHPIVKSAMLHKIFISILPFIDGNGRTARLLLNFELMKEGYPPIIIDIKDRKAYNNALDTAIAKADYTDFIYIVAKSTENSLDLHLNVL